MPAIDPQLLTILIRDIAIPEVLAVIKAHQNATNGTTPTDAQILAALNTDSDRFEAIGQAFLARTAPAVP